MLLYLIRHGDPIYDPDSLTPLGHRQAEAIGKRLSQRGLDRIYASSSTRAMQTAQPTAEMLKMNVAVLDWCSEVHTWRELTCHYPDGRTDWCFHDPEIVRLFQSAEILALGRRWYDHPAFENTTFALGMERVQRESDAFLRSLGYAHHLDENCYTVDGVRRERIALFAHHGFGMAFLSCILDLPFPLLSTRFDISHSGMTVVEFPEEGNEVYPTVLTLSNDAHLYREGLPTRYGNRIDI